MSLRFLIDTQLPPILGKVLNENGLEAIHTTHYANGHLLNDSQIRKLAIEEERIIITKDKDFLDYFLVKGAPPGILLIDTGNIKNKNLYKIIRANSKVIENLFLYSSMVIIQPEKIISY
jgi:predicted nuclease of predicted toxin-antitoxin system